MMNWVVRKKRLSELEDQVCLEECVWILEKRRLFHIHFPVHFFHSFVSHLLHRLANQVPLLPASSFHCSLSSLPPPLVTCHVPCHPWWSAYVIANHQTSGLTGQTLLGTLYILVFYIYRWLWLYSNINGKMWQLNLFTIHWQELIYKL